MRLFHELGETIEARWRAADYDEAAFPALAAEALQTRALHRELGWADVLRWVLESDALPFQDDVKGRFGDPPVTVFHGRRFFIQVLLWREGSTSIHRHGFSGAFQVLEGTSLHTRYDFTRTRRVSSHLELGALRLRDASTLARGAVEPITADLAHALYHLESHAATIVVRTYREDDAGPQFSYRAPGLAIDPFYDDPVATRQAQSLRFFRTADPVGGDALAERLAARADLHTGYLVLSEIARGAGSAARVDRVVAALRARHGDDVAALLHDVVREEMRERRVLELRDGADDADQRYLLALLANLHDRESVLALVKERAPDADPRAWAMEHLAGLSGADRLGVDLDDAFTLDAALALLDLDDDRAVLARLAEVYPRDEITAQRDDVLAHLARLRRSALRPLFTPRR
ncbi:MAG: hypothetical protein U0324_14170 [Polyangiales bacterium]